MQQLDISNIDHMNFNNDTLLNQTNPTILYGNNNTKININPEDLSFLSKIE